MARTSFPNLTVSPMLHAQPRFDAVVLQGAPADKALESSAEELKPEDPAAVRKSLIARANGITAAGPAAFGPLSGLQAQPAQRQETGNENQVQYDHRTKVRNA
jgi:hypothetical protein